MYFSNSLYPAGSEDALAMNRQFESVTNRRNATNNHIAALVVNAGRTPESLYLEFDRTITTEFKLDEGDAILNALMSLQKSVSIGRTIVEYARSSDGGVASTSMSGTAGIKFDGIEYDTAGTLVPMHDTGFEIPFREYDQQRLDGFDMTIDLQRESARTLRQQYVKFAMDGSPITHKGKKWQGFRADPTVEQVSLGAGGLNVDFTSASLTGANFRNGFLALVKQLYVTNKINVPATYFVSNEILFNAQRYYADVYESGTILDHLKRITGVADIVATSALTGNQVLAIVLNKSFIQPVVGMAVNTVALSRPEYNSPYRWATWGAMGILVKNDWKGSSGVMYAAS